MFKCNSLPSSRRFAQESDSLTTIESLPSCHSGHELNGQDAAILARIEKMREIMKSLRQKLAVEKDKLARERIAAKSMFTFQSTRSTSENLVPLHSFRSLPISSNMCNFSDYAGVSVHYAEDYYPWSQMYHNNLNGYCSSQPVFVSDPALDLFKAQLDNVEKLCAQEFNKMQDSINNLRASKQYLNTKTSSDNNCIFLAEANISDDAAHECYEKSNHKNQRIYRKFYRRHHRSPKHSSVYVMDDSSTNDDHRSHYRFHYHSSPKQRYIKHKNHELWFD